MYLNHQIHPCAKASWSPFAEDNDVKKVKGKKISVPKTILQTLEAYDKRYQEALKKGKKILSNSNILF